jgi:hypothetical protein
LPPKRKDKSYQRRRKGRRGKRQGNKLETKEKGLLKKNI